MKYLYAMYLRLFFNFSRGEKRQIDRAENIWFLIWILILYYEVDISS